MSALKFLMVAAWLVIPSLSLQASERKLPRVEVFTLSDRPVRGVEALERQDITVDVYVVDAVEHINRTLSTGLPVDAPQAIAIASRRIQQQTADLARRYHQAARGLLRAQRLGVQRVPAVVFDDGQTVVLGVTDLEAALSIAQHRPPAGRRSP
jgi:integrating conjugative element protein (TIGR03757 family)